MKRLLLLNCFLLIAFAGFANIIPVKDIEELHKANTMAQPGDTIVLQNGIWNNVSIKLTAAGTKEKPITVKAQTAGKVMISGNSRLLIGGNYIIVDGLCFINGFAGADAVITFRANKNQLANNCRVTNCVINDFNNPGRMAENYWVAFYGKKNRVDHCSFKDKKNMGVLVAVILDDERSRENFHSIDHNYFGNRPPLASNGGEIIRVGVSQHCQFNSNTQITENFFEHCDGETEIVSIKSCSNVIRNNVFKESQGSVVLRHGDNNTVENNLFLGNGKPGTGGVRVINKGQWVINNFFYKCRGLGFRSPLAIMNGIPNSPAHRYVQVTDAVIANNTYFDCSSISFCEGSDTERSLPPSNVILANNLFYNSHDSIIYKVFDNIKGFTFLNNEISNSIKQDVIPGFTRTSFSTQKNDAFPFPVSNRKIKLTDSLQLAAAGRLGHPLLPAPGFSDLALLKKVQVNAFTKTGAGWFTKNSKDISPKSRKADCANAAELYAELEKQQPVMIRLTGSEYKLDRPFSISSPISITGNALPVLFITDTIQAVFVIKGGGSLLLQNLSMDGVAVKASSFIASDSSGSSAHYNFSLQNCSLSNFSKERGCRSIFYAHKSIVADSIILRNNSFSSNDCAMLLMISEKDNKGYYNAEKVMIGHNKIDNSTGTLLAIYRGGNDESTLGPDLIVSHNKISNCATAGGSPLFELTGVQQTKIFSNQFVSCNTGGVLLRYTDIVRADHRLEKNTVTSCGKIIENKFVTKTENSIY